LLANRTMGLHERKKNAHNDPEAPDEGGGHQEKQPPPSSGGSARLHKRKSMLSSEIRYALSAVGGFLFLGLLLGYFLLHHQHRKLIGHLMRDPFGHLHHALRGRTALRVGFRHHFYTGSPRTVTVVMPSVVNPKKRTQRLQSILETWGPSARAVYVVHNISEFPEASQAVLSEYSTPKDPYSYPQLMVVPPSIGVDDGLPRLNHVIRTVYEKIDPDFAFFVNDHTFVIPEHLCYFLENEDASKDMYAGHALKNDQDVFNSGAAGYVLSRKTMQRLVEKWDQDDPICLLKDGNKWLQNNPGLVTTQCLKKVLDVGAIDTRHSGYWHRFHAFPLTRMVSGKVDEWYKNKHKDLDAMMDTDSSYSILLSGVDCCAEDTVSFHYVEGIESRALFSTREALLENPHMSDHELKNLMLAEWPRERKDIGGYSRGLPTETDHNDWKPLLHVMRKMSQRHTQRDC
jgi:hypothetical protein